MAKGAAACTVAALTSHARLILLSLMSLILRRYQRMTEQML